MASETKHSSACAPLLKWPGGKRDLLPQLRRVFPPTVERRYFEPFVGGGAVFFSLVPRRAFLSDADEELINCYTMVRDAVGDVIRALWRLPNNEEAYYRVRSSVPRSQVARAARLIYLCTLSFNGIYRRNLRGEFNVPYGRKTHVIVCDEERIVAASDALRGVTLASCDFETTTRRARSGDVVYLDPPYTVAHSNNGFVKYNAKIFSWHDQIRLASVARDLAERGCHVIVSNADHSSIRDLYSDFSVAEIERPSRIAADPRHRRRITECIFHT